MLYIVFAQMSARYATADWPSQNSSTIRLLGLFRDAGNISQARDVSVHSGAMFKAAVLLSQRSDITIGGKRIEWQLGQTGGDAIDALGVTCESVSQSNILGIVGPQTSREAILIAKFGQKLGIPVVSYGATDPELSDRNNYPTFYRTVPADNIAALALLQFFMRFNWTSCVIIYQNDVFGYGGAKVISELFARYDLVVLETIVFDIATQSIRGNLGDHLRKIATRIVVVWADSLHTSKILQTALDSDVVGPQFTWILNSLVSLNSFDGIYHQKLIGMFTIEPAVGTNVNAPMNQTLLNAAYQVWQQYEPESFPGSDKVTDYALFAFDATWLLIQSLQQFCSETNNCSSSCFACNESSSCFHRRYLHSELLFDIISRTDFLGVSGLVQFNVNLTDRVIGSYYVAQNVQPSSDGLSFVPVLDYINSVGWKAHTGVNVILWPGNSLNVSTDRAMLKGITLRIGVIDTPPFTIVERVNNTSGQNQTKFTGYIIDLIKLLGNQTGFIPNIQLVVVNVSYSELIEAVEKGVYDIIMGDVTITSNRRKLVDFSNSIFDNSLRIIMRATVDVHIDILSFLKPFSRNLWILILAAFVYAGLLLCLIERKHNEALKERSIVSQLAMSVWYSFGNIVGFGADFEVNTAAGRLLTAGLYILSLILVASYTANLASDLTLSKSKYLISGIDDIKKDKLPANRIGVLRGTASEDYYVREVSLGKYNFHRLDSVDDLYSRLLNGDIDVSFLDSGIAEYVTNNVYCNLTLIGESFDSGVFGIVTPKGWLYLQDLDVNILLLTEAGELENLKEKWFSTKDCSGSLETTTAIGIESTTGLFLVFAAFSFCSLILLAWTERRQIKNNFFKTFSRKKFAFRTK